MKPLMRRSRLCPKTCGRGWGASRSSSRIRACNDGNVAMARITEMHKKWMKEPKYKKAYEALEEEFVLAGAVMDVRNRAGLTQEELARRMGTTQPVGAPD